VRPVFSDLVNINQNIHLKKRAKGLLRKLLITLNILQLNALSIPIYDFPSENDLILSLKVVIQNQ
jgi:hypothetical protein